MVNQHQGKKGTKTPYSPKAPLEVVLLVIYDCFEHVILLICCSMLIPGKMGAQHRHIAAERSHERSKK